MFFLLLINQQCDALKPICGRCNKRRRECLYADRFKFVYENRNHIRAENHPWHLTASRNGDVYKYTSERRTPGGGLFQKWHTSIFRPSITTTLPLSPVELQCLRLTKCWDEGPMGMRFDLVAGWLKILPRRLGNSLALDDTVHLLSTIHDQMIKGKDPSCWVCPSTYIKALRSLRKVLIDPEQGHSVETMAAALLLYHIEVNWI
jgi:hypothetical protein